jgi:hypothetical protein
MIRFKESSIVIEIKLGYNPLQQLPFYQKAIIEALKNINGDLEAKDYQFINYWLTDLLHQTMFDEDQLFAIENELKNSKCNKELKQTMLGNIVDV